MNSIKLLLNSSLGKKIVMAVSGAGLLAFVVGHMVGNLQIFLPPEAINRYAHFLQSTPELLWPVRIGMLTLLVLHVWSALRVSAENKAARPIAYAKDPAAKTASYASRTMLVSGVVIACFLVFHLLHYTVRVEGINGSSVPFSSLKDPVTGHNDVYAMVVAGFKVWYVTVFYVIGITLLCLHLSHGISALFQSLGLMNRAYRSGIDNLARGLAILLFCGYVIIPVAILVLGHGQDHLNQVIEHAQSGAVTAEEKK